MKIKNKKLAVRGILFILLGAAIAVVRFLIFSYNDHGLLKPILAIMVCLFVGIVHVILAFQNEDGEDNVEEDK